jgi:6-phosphofructokinase 1
MTRQFDLTRVTTERSILDHHFDEGNELQTKVKEVKGRDIFKQPYERQNELGLFRAPNARKAVIADVGFLENWKQKELEVPSFLEAGPRRDLRFDPSGVRRGVHAAIVTAGGLAPGLHCVIHSIVKRHCHTYRIANGKIYGVYNSFKGLCNLEHNLIELDPEKTEEWLDQGGCKLGIVRHRLEEEDKEKKKTPDEAIAEMADIITQNLQSNHIDILYVLGGDGTMRVAHQIAERNPTRSVIGVPKTMDNDILWVWQSFGFNTAVKQATQVINTLRNEAEATRRVGLIQLFGAESGFVAANAALASGHVDAVLIPEVIKALSREKAENYLKEIVSHIETRIDTERRLNPHAVVVVAEGVGTYLEEMEACIEKGVKAEKKRFINQLKDLFENRIKGADGKSVPVFVNEPQHYIRSVAANAHDQIYCERLGALAVDNALAGFTDCMISQWLTEFVLVPLDLVVNGQKSIPVQGMFWKQVVSTTRQPLSPAEEVTISGDAA